jgi:hypothetical protein
MSTAEPESKGGFGRFLPLIVFLAIGAMFAAI